MLQHVNRSATYNKPLHYVKCIHNTDKPIILHNHVPFACLGSCSTESVDPAVAHLQHYRKDCVPELKKSCSTIYRNNTIMDTTLWRWKDRVAKNSKHVLRKLGYFG
jgi:hypothetical protein